MLESLSLFTLVEGQVSEYLMSRMNTGHGNTPSNFRVNRNVLYS